MQPYPIKNTEQTSIPGINPQHTFENFLVNSLKAPYLLTCKAMADFSTKADIINPLLICGPVGSGKTHLAQAIANALLARGYSNVLYRTAEAFCNELIDSIRNSKTAKLRKRYRSVDALIIDDIEHLAGKERTMEALCHTIEALCMQKRPVVLTSLSVPAKLSNKLHPKLRQLMVCGVTAIIPYPDSAIKSIYIKRMLAAADVTAESSVIDMLASHTTSIRELQGVTNTLIRSHASSNPIGMVLAEHVVNQLIGSVSTATTRCESITLQAEKGDADDSFSPLFDGEAAQIDTPLGPLQFPEWVTGKYLFLANNESHKSYLTHLLFPRFTVHWRTIACTGNRFTVEIDDLLGIDEESRSMLSFDDGANNCWRKKAVNQLSRLKYDDNKEKAQ